MGKSKEQRHKGAKGFYVTIAGLEPDSISYDPCVIVLN
jgi:hypothetical protein